MNAIIETIVTKIIRGIIPTPKYVDINFVFSFISLNSFFNQGINVKFKNLGENQLPIGTHAYVFIIRLHEIYELITIFAVKKKTKKNDFEPFSN